MSNDTISQFVYTNWKKEKGLRTVTSPMRIYFGTTEYHPTLQLLLEAYDLDKKDMRTFAVSDIETAPEVTLVSVAKELIRLGEKAQYLLKEANLDLKKQRLFVDTDNYRKELIQVAAVAIAALTDLEMQKALLKGDQEFEITLQEIELGIWSDILEERNQQYELFKHDFPFGQDPLLWPVILLEEVAEVVSKIALNWKAPFPGTPPLKKGN